MTGIIRWLYSFCFFQTCLSLSMVCYIGFIIHGFNYLLPSITKTCFMRKKKGNKIKHMMILSLIHYIFHIISSYLVQASGAIWHQYLLFTSVSWVWISYNYTIFKYIWPINSHFMIIERIRYVTCN